MIHRKIMQEVMSQHFKIKDDLTNENIEDAMDNYTDRLLRAKIISVQANVSGSLPSEPTDIEVLLELHHHLDICGHNINSNLKEKLREMIKRGNDR